MGESSKFQKAVALHVQILKLILVCTVCQSTHLRVYGDALVPVKCILATPSLSLSLLAILLR